MRQSKGESWAIALAPGYRPTLDINHSLVTLYKGELPLPVDRAEVHRRYLEQQEAAIKTPRDAYELDLSVPQGTYYPTLADHYSIHHDFPLTYGIGEEGLPDTVPTLRRAQANQLKGYLIFFDQLLANYLVQLAHVRDLFSWEIDPETEAHGSNLLRAADQQHTYFDQALDFPGWADLLGDSQYLEAIAEDKTTYRDRRNRFLDHLLARFAESFSEYALLNYQLYPRGADKPTVETNLIADKARFLQDYPALERDRSRAFNYALSPTQYPENISGFQQRVSRLLGIESATWRKLSPEPLELAPEDFIWTLVVDPTAPPLQSHAAYATEAEASAAFEALKAIAQTGAGCRRLTYPSEQKTTYGYAIFDAERCPLVFSPVRYDTAPERDEAILKLQSFLQGNPSASVAPRAGYWGQIQDQAGEVLLQSDHRYAFEEQAWQKIYDLMKWAEDSQNFQAIDSDDGLYGWELPRKPKTIATSPCFYPTPAARDQAIETLQQQVRQLSLEMEGLHVVEHLLLRPRTIPPPPLPEGTSRETAPILDNFLPIAVTPEDASTLMGESEPKHLVWQDPYSFWVTVVLPYWPSRFQNMNFRRFVERTLRLEAPAHIALRIAWVEPGQMRMFEDAYHAWLDQLAIAAQGGTPCHLSESLNQFIDILFKLRSVYPEATLYDPAVSSPEDTPVVLNQTALGTTED